MLLILKSCTVQHCLSYPTVNSISWLKAFILFTPTNLILPWPLPADHFVTVTVLAVSFKPVVSCYLTVWMTWPTATPPPTPPPPPPPMGRSCDRDYVSVEIPQLSLSSAKWNRVTVFFNRYRNVTFTQHFPPVIPCGVTVVLLLQKQHEQHEPEGCWLC